MLKSCYFFLLNFEKRIFWHFSKKIIFGKFRKKIFWHFSNKFFLAKKILEDLFIKYKKKILAF